MTPSHHLEMAMKLHERMEKHLLPINERLSFLLGEYGSDVYLLHQAGDGWVIVWGFGNNTPISPTGLRELLMMSQAEAMDWLTENMI